MKRLKNLIALCLAVALIIILAGCSDSSSNTDSDTDIVSNDVTTEPTLMPAIMTQQPVLSTEQTPVPATGQEAGVFSGLTDKQRDSINMLNYLTVLTQEINSSKNSRMYLEGAYSSIVNNTYPNAVDNRTLGELNTILDTLEDYRMIAVKRERLEYIYEQNKAQALRSAIPNPLGLLSAVKSFNMAQLVASVAYMAIDSVASYKSASSQADLQYLRDGWALDDEQAKVLHNQRKEMFNYMVRTVNENDLPGELSLTEQTVSDLVNWENNTNITSRIQFLESKQDVYQAYGGYWLILADSYYNIGNYAKCLEAIAAYEKLDIGIFRRDYEYAEILPLAIVSASAVLNTDEYIYIASQYAEKLCVNSADRAWDLRYFAAQTYIDLYAKSGDFTYLQKAYDVVLNNINNLIKEQQSLNAKYIAPVVEEEAPQGATKAQKAEIEKYNEMLKERRETELPPVYEPLLINCELLFSLASEMDIPEEEKTRVSNILHHNGAYLFLSKPVDNMFKFDAEEINTADIDISFDGEEISIPASYLSSTAKIKVRIESGSKVYEFSDFVIEEIERESKKDVDRFIVTYTSETLDDFDYSRGMQIVITVIPCESNSVQTLVFSYKAVNDENWWIIPDGIKFERTEQ